MLGEKIKELRRELIEYATFVENMIDKSINGLLSKDREQLDEVIEKDEPKANETEIILDELCTGMIAQYQPKAKDLRTILMVLKINNDLERIADYAVNISKSALFLIDRPQVKPLTDTPKMAEESVKMLKDSISSYINEDPVLAQNVCERDSVVDELGNKILQELITLMAADPSKIERSLHLLKIARSLERIADLSTNICEDVIFMVEGEVIKHNIFDKSIPM
ncbi:MAG: phosphate signaling complex protein PhoU [Proteobacteria bacterium]|nr:phosphate signaling complex protein PhoU [Pseudomonadota bacterium]